LDEFFGLNDINFQFSEESQPGTPNITEFIKFLHHYKESNPCPPGHKSFIYRRWNDEAHGVGERDHPVNNSGKRSLDSAYFPSVRHKTLTDTPMFSVPTKKHGLRVEAMIMIVMTIGEWLGWYSPLLGPPEPRGILNQQFLMSDLNLEEDGENTNFFFNYLYGLKLKVVFK